MDPHSPAAGHLPQAVADVLADFRRECDSSARLWLRHPQRWEELWPNVAVPPTEAPGEHAVPVENPAGPPLWVEVGGTGARFLAHTLRRVLRHDAEVRGFSREIAERYEEITLLYSISEILGSVISMSEAASTILAEVISTLGAQRAVLWVYDPASDRLERAAAVGEGTLAPIDVDDESSMTARVFRERRPILLAPNEVVHRASGDDSTSRRGALLSVPVSYTPPEGESRTIGVINLMGRVAPGPFSAGDLKLLSAIASQIGAAVENSRLVAESLRQERFLREMELAHDLQLKLLPSVEQFHGYAEVAARCAPAESVGGDFYHLFRLPGHRLGVMIGDVSSHGFAAALIMALTMSAVAIHASEGDPPAEVLRRVHHALIGELETTEMHLSLFYGVIDPVAGELRYANAGHGHAFRIDGDARAERLGATNPPLGIVDLDAYGEARVEWRRGEDLLFLFTDGLPDALGKGEIEGERALLGEVCAERTLPVDSLIEHLFALSGEQTVPPDDRTAVLVRI